MKKVMKYFEICGILSFVYFCELKAKEQKKYVENALRYY